MAILFVTGIDTGIGKTVACGLLAKFLLKRGESVITQKLVQTGCHGVSSDIRIHRRIMGIPLTSEDRDGTTCPYVLTLAASPHLAAAREGQCIETTRLSSSTRRLSSRYHNVLIEGVGGIEVPLRDNLSTLDYVASRRYSVVVVSSSRLGSINHTMLTLRALRDRAIQVRGIIYNRVQGEDRIIAEDTRRVLLRALRKYGCPAAVVDLPHFRNMNKPPEVDFSPLFANSRSPRTETRHRPGVRKHT